MRIAPPTYKYVLRPKGGVHEYGRVRTFTCDMERSVVVILILEVAFQRIHYTPFRKNSSEDFNKLHARANANDVLCSRLHMTPVAYPEFVSRGVSERRKCKRLAKVGASNGVTP